MRLTHSDRLERWLGTENIAHVSSLMKDWYGPPIALHGVPGAVYACGDGDFIGDIRDGWEATAYDYAWDLLKRMKRGARVATSPRRAQLNAGFASLSDLIAEATAGKRLDLTFSKVGTSALAIGGGVSLWGAAGLPSAGSAASASPGGRAPTDATTGSFPFTNPTGGDTLHFVSGFATASVVANTLLLYDRIFDVLKAASSSATESVTGVPTRYQSSTQGNADYAGGNFLFVEQFTALASTAHNWTTCLYRNQAGTDAQTFPSFAGLGTGGINRLDHNVAGQWFAPLAAGDTGVMALNQMQCSSAAITGSANFVIGHPIAWMPCPVANLLCGVDGINTSFNLARIFNDACLAFIEAPKPATNATTYSGTLTAVAG